MAVFDPYKFLPALILICLLTFSLKLAEVVSGLRSLSGPAYAEDTMTPPESGMQQAPASPDPMETPAQETPAAEVPKGDKKPLVYEDNAAQMPEWKDAGDSAVDLSDAKKNVIEDMAKRRVQLDGFEKELKAREALLKAAEQELDRKYKELSRLKEEIEGLLKQQSEEEQNRVKSLVKVYEGMKPKDAARIFDTLDLDILVEVMSHMSERKLSPVLAAMNPERARTVTIMLAEQKQLPELPPGQ
ncbi:MAG: flagellar protein FlbB [Alphaproteobacteria bacterium]|nr:flagellar protein FlbB [Alphaproteobacteria bacterium]